MTMSWPSNMILDRVAEGAIMISVTAWRYMRIIEWNCTSGRACDLGLAYLYKYRWMVFGEDGGPGSPKTATSLNTVEHTRTTDAWRLSTALFV